MACIIVGTWSLQGRTCPASSTGSGAAGSLQLSGRATGSEPRPFGIAHGQCTGLEAGKQACRPCWLENKPQALGSRCKQVSFLAYPSTPHFRVQMNPHLPCQLFFLPPACPTEQGTFDSFSSKSESKEEAELKAKNQTYAACPSRGALGFWEQEASAQNESLQGSSLGPLSSERKHLIGRHL